MEGFFFQFGSLSAVLEGGLHRLVPLSIPVDAYGLSKDTVNQATQSQREGAGQGELRRDGRPAGRICE